MDRLGGFRVGWEGGSQFVVEHRNVRIRQMADEHGRALAERQYRVGLYLCVGRQHALGEAGDDRFGEIEVLHARNATTFRPRLARLS